MSPTTLPNGEGSAENLYKSQRLASAMIMVRLHLIVQTEQGLGTLPCLLPQASLDPYFTLALDVLQHTKVVI